MYSKAYMHVYPILCSEVKNQFKCKPCYMSHGFFLHEWLMLVKITNMMLPANFMVVRVTNKTYHYQVVKCEVVNITKVGSDIHH